ncbi:DUF3298 domain-containing protein [Aquimarina sp. SS2-1]|uniref:DUF3298 and DUF4163 domain-containing protein n=1 Tax=Aquimarina besae TaxID=3342247 RepID=UPI00366F12C8
MVDDFFDCEVTDCVITEIFLLESVSEDKISKDINQLIEKTAISILNIEEDNSITTVEKAVQNFNNSYQEIKKEFPEEIMPYEVSIHCDISFQNANILSVIIDSYLFAGGAHGSGNSTYLNIDPKTGKSIENQKMIKDINQFSTFVEKKFRKTHSIPENASINSTGFFFENDIFSLPINIGLTDTHIILLYNQYEISSYAEGPIELKLDKQEVKDYFALNILQ